MADQSQRIFPITGKIFSSPYDWGGKELIPQTLGFTPEPGVPYAEYWIGAHKRAPSMVEYSDGTKSLEEIIAGNPEDILGSEVAKRFGELPFLFKLSEAKKMLSVQVHPNKKQAEEGFAIEEKSGIPATDLKRTFKDPNSKTEMPLALGDFWLLHGLRPESEMLEILKETKELTPLIPIFGNNDYRALYKHVLSDMSKEEVNTMLSPLAMRIRRQYEDIELQKTSPDYWAAKAIKDFNMQEGDYDRGLFSLYFANIVHLKAGDALFQNEGVIHAFLEGQYIEIMQNSDNIARAGMTNKPIDIEGLMKFMTFTSQKPNILEGRKENNEIFYDAPADEFLVSQLLLKDGMPYKQTSYSVEILMGITGNATITSDGISLPLGQGKSIVVFADATYEITGTETDVIFKTAVPHK